MSNNSFNADLRPFINDFNSLEIGSFLTSSFYERKLVKWGFSELWQIALDKVAEENRIVVLGHDMSSYDAKKAFIYIANALYRNQGEPHGVFEKLVFYTLQSFILRNKNPIDLADLLEDLEVLEFSKESIGKLRQLFNEERIKNNDLQPKDLPSEEFRLKENEILKVKKTEWLKLLAKAKIDVVISELLLEIEKISKDSKSEVINISSRFYRLQQKVQKDLIDLDAESKEMNKINDSLITIINSIGVVARIGYK